HLQIHRSSAPTGPLRSARLSAGWSHYSREPLSVAMDARRFRPRRLLREEQHAGQSGWRFSPRAAGQDHRGRSKTSRFLLHLPGNDSALSGSVQGVFQRADIQEFLSGTMAGFHRSGSSPDAESKSSEMKWLSGGLTFVNFATISGLLIGMLTGGLSTPVAFSAPFLATASGLVHPIRSTWSAIIFGTRLGSISSSRCC